MAFELPQPNALLCREDDFAVRLTVPEGASVVGVEKSPGDPPSARLLFGDRDPGPWMPMAKISQMDGPWWPSRGAPVMGLVYDDGL